MALIDNPEAVRFCNERIRPAADILAKAYRLAKEVDQEWWARGLNTKIPSGSTDFVDDGSDVDGRPRITGKDVNLLITRLEELIAGFEAGSNAKLNTILKVAVNGGE